MSLSRTMKESLNRITLNHPKQHRSTNPKKEHIPWLMASHIALAMSSSYDHGLKDSATIPIRNIHMYQTCKTFVLRSTAWLLLRVWFSTLVVLMVWLQRRPSLCHQTAYSGFTQAYQGPTHSSCSIFVMCLPGTTTSPTYLFKNGICGFDVPAFSAAALMTASEGGRYSCVKARMMLHSYK